MSMIVSNSGPPTTKRDVSNKYNGGSDSNDSMHNLVSTRVYLLIQSLAPLPHLLTDCLPPLSLSAAVLPSPLIHWLVPAAMTNPLALAV